ncbi:MAG: SdpI family protein [Bacteroidota bacterium]
MKRSTKEIIQWLLFLLPYFYLYIIWNSLADQVPTHFNLSGHADNYSSKTSLLYVPSGMGIFIYVLMLLIPFLDPKKKIQMMGGTYVNFRMMMTFFFSLLAVYCLYMTKEGQIKNPGYVVALIGLMIAMMGNYFQALRPNYFIGLRSPWTLESETVWKKTHLVGGRVWMAGGILICILSLAISNIRILMIPVAVILAIITFFHFIYSYMEFKNEKKLTNQ